jgi:hypothetical protein
VPEANALGQQLLLALLLQLGDLVDDLRLILVLLRQ